MRAKRSSLWSSVSLAMACRIGALAGLALCSAPALAEQIGLRPSMTATSYIHVMPSEAFSSSFAEMIRNAVQKSDAVQAAAARWHAEQYGVDAAAGAQLPSGAFFGEAGIAAGSDNNTPYAYGVRVSVPLYDGNSAGFATEAQSAMSEAARLAAVDELAATLVDLVAAAASIRRAEETLDARRVQYAAMQDLLAAIVSERDTGTASKVDTDQVEAQLAQIEIELKAAEAARIQARESFARIAGQAPNYVGNAGSIARFLPSNQAAASAIAIQENPQLAQRLALAIAANFTTSSVKASFGPDLSLDLSAGASGDMFNTVSASPEASALLRLEVPFAFGTEAAVQQRALEAQAAEFEVSAAQLGVTAGIESAYARLQTTRGSLSLAYEALERSRTVLTGIKTERDLGERSIFDLLTAQNALAEARIRLSGLQYELTVAEHLLAAQIGRIDDIYGLGLN
ncbi:TolC family protein [Devosia sp. SL43]|uniref:TolC family protein n=1 Tax=Devosia sp. SL43 TaxID=2806348 RepID=UPI001F0184E3|nr:TolC family protein [Devosia sp. SL43]UJW85362.1 TolC family protein [Devosia sp. SL43]